jgi:ribosomal protein S8|tara:strand:- start:443 stop:799 length:357 start_codon:yes stop_codon:yes gene_type:complete
MNHSFIQLFNAYRTSIVRKKTKLNLKFSQQNLLFAEFLLKNALISGFNTQIQRKNKTITLFLKYDQKNLPAINDFSVASKVSFPRPITKISSNDENLGFIINLTQKKGNYGRLLARIR